MRRRTSALATGTMLAVALGVSACGGGSSDDTRPSGSAAPTGVDTTSVPGYTLSPGTPVSSISVAPVVTGAPAGDLQQQASSFAAAADMYIAEGNKSFADDDNLLDPVKFLDAIGWQAPPGVSVARIDTDNQGGVSYEVCIAKDSGAWVVYDSKQKKVVESGPKNQSCGDM